MDKLFESLSQWKPIPLPQHVPDYHYIPTPSIHVYTAIEDLPAHSFIVVMRLITGKWAAFPADNLVDLYIYHDDIWRLAMPIGAWQKVYTIRDTNLPEGRMACDEKTFNETYRYPKMWWAR